MYAMEVIQLRLFDVNDGAKVIEAFNQFAQEPPSSRATLYRSAKVGNDWSICFWKPVTNEMEWKSGQAIGFAESLRRIGLVHHALWLPVAGNQLETQTLQREHGAPRGYF
jgi:hypothetical protein